MASTSSSAQIQYLGDLEKCGIATSNNLRELLTTCLDPVEGIKQFQSMNSIQLPSLKPVMKLLDLHGIRRTEYHEAVISDLTERMVAKIKMLGQSPNSENVHRLEQHLERCFRLYRVPRIRPIVLETLAQLPKVADRYLKLIICDKELYDQCAVTVRQQIWVKNESLFLESVEPVLNSYIYEKEQQLEIHLGNCSSNIEKAVERKESSGSKNKPQIPTINTTNFFTNETAKCRRQRRQIQELITMIGQREQLYSRLVDLIRERYLATENAHFCSLRFDLLMAAHDASLEFLARADPCHDFAWCLDACSKHLRTKHLDAQQLAKLKTLLDIGGKKGQQAKPIPEMAMIAGDPHILHLIASFTVKMLRDNAAAGANGHLPREMASLQLLLKILQMGLNTPKLVGGQISIQQWAALDQPELSTIFLAAFSSMLCQDVIRAELATASETVIERFGEEHTSIRKRNPTLDRFLRDRPICALLWLHHLTQGDAAHCPLSATKRQHFEAANAFRYAEPLPWMMNKMAINDPWVQLLAHKLMHSPTAMANEQLANLFIRRLFIANLQKIPSAKFHLLRLCVQHRLILPTDLLAKSIDGMEKCAAAEEKAEIELEEGQLPPAIGKFAIEFGKHKEMLIETKQLRKGDNDEEEEEEEREEGELPQEDEEDEDEEEEMTNWPGMK